MIESQLRILHPNPKNLPWGGDSKVHFIEPRRWTSPFTIFVSRRCRGSFGCRWAGLLAAGLTPLPVRSLWPLANRPVDVTMSALFLPRFLCHPFFFFHFFFLNHTQSLLSGSKVNILVYVSRKERGRIGTWKMTKEKVVFTKVLTVVVIHFEKQTAGGCREFDCTRV